MCHSPSPTCHPPRTPHGHDAVSGNTGAGIRSAARDDRAVTVLSPIPPSVAVLSTPTRHRGRRARTWQRQSKWRRGPAATATEVAFGGGHGRTDVNEADRGRAPLVNLLNEAAVDLAGRWPAPPKVIVLTTWPSANTM